MNGSIYGTGLERRYGEGWFGYNDFCVTLFMVDAQPPFVLTLFILQPVMEITNLLTIYLLFHLGEWR